MPQTSDSVPETLGGTVEEVVYFNPDNGYCVLQVNSNGEEVTCVGNLAEVSEGEEILFSGEWCTHHVHGRQFRFSSVKRSMPDTVGKLYRYLASGAVKGIGAKTAAKIIERFGENSFYIMENEPDRLAEIVGVSKKKALDIGVEFNRQFTMRKIMLELEEFGITASECTAAYKLFGMNAVNVIKENPYILCTSLPSFSFDRAVRLTQSMGLSPKPAYKNRAGILYIIKYNLYSNGHTCIPLKKLYSPASELLGIGEAETRETIDDLVKMHCLALHETDGEPYLFLPEIFKAESDICEKLKNIVRFPPASLPGVEELIEKTEKSNEIKYESLQRKAIFTAAEKGLLILTGGPGTGKTTTVRGIIDIFEKRNIEVLLCAPTGMAAKRLSEVTGREAKTIHRLLEVEWDESETPVFRRNAENPLTAGAVIVDEMSMVDVQLFASLLYALPLGCRLILVGDSEQLPSVGPGNVLGDMIKADTLPLVCLTEIFRQAQQSLIVMNAHSIINGRMPVLDAKDNDFYFLKRTGSLVSAKTVAELISSRLPSAYGFDPMNDIQVLCPSKKGDCGTVSLNIRLQGILNPKDKLKNEISTRAGRVFREGDRVMQIKNNYSIEWEKPDETGEGIFNGDIGIIKKIFYGAGYMDIVFDDRKAKYPLDNLSELELAYAVTVHKSQGSEYPVVIIPVIDCPPQLMYRNLLYTAVTRAKKILILVGSEERIAKMTENNKVNKRYSALYNFLTEQETKPW